MSEDTLTAYPVDLLHLENCPDGPVWPFSGEVGLCILVSFAERSRSFCLLFLIFYYL